MTVDVHLIWCENLTLKSKGLDPVSKNLWQFLIFGEMPIILLHISSLHLCRKNTWGIKEIINHNKNIDIKKKEDRT